MSLIIINVLSNLMKKYLLVIVYIILLNSMVMGASRIIASVIFASEKAPYKEAWAGVQKCFNERKVALWSSEYFIDIEKPENIRIEIYKKKPDIVIVFGTTAMKFALREIKDIPVVYSMVIDTIKPEPENITGVIMSIPYQLKLEKIKEIIPELKKVGFIYSEKESAEYNKIVHFCKLLNIKAIGRKANSIKEFPDALKEIIKKIDIFLMIPDPNIYIPHTIKHLLVEGIKNKFPVMGLSSLYTKAGALISFDCDYEDLGYQTGDLSLEILDGKSPATINTKRPRKVKVSINIITAKELEIMIPITVIESADKIYGE